MIHQVGTFTTADGLSLRQRSWVPDDRAPRAVVGLLHGGAEHSGRYPHTAERFTGAGFEVDAFDQRSHGASERARGVPLQIERFGDLLDDTEAWLGSRRAVHGGFDAGTRDPEMRAIAVADELHADVEGVPARFMAEVAAITAAVVDELDRVWAPLLVLHGTEDRMAAPARSVELVERAASTDKTLHLVEGGYHSLLRVLDRAATEDLIVGWIEARLPGR